MKKSIYTLLSLLSINMLSYSQSLTNHLKFDQGQILEISLQVKNTISQQAMGQAIDFTVDASGNHSYQVTNTTEANSTLHHSVNRITFSFDGMGQKKSFDSKEEKDINGQFGKSIKDLLDKKYDIIIDPFGNTLLSIPEKIQLTENDSRMAIISNMLKDVIDIVQPPQKGKASFFKVLPEKEPVKGLSWTESYSNESGKFDAAYVISDINDTTLIVDFAGNSITVSKAEMMGNETLTTMNNKSTGKIVLDRLTGIIREKTINTESNGNTEASFGTIPVTSKNTTIITVKPVL
jgi:hypothetical protein